MLKIRIYDEVILEDVSNLLNVLPQELDEIMDYVSQDRPDLYKRRLDLLMISTRISALVLRVAMNRMVSKDE
jgi:hypothetical protein